MAKETTWENKDDYIPHWSEGAPVADLTSLTSWVDARHILTQKFFALLKELGELHEKKGKDYGSLEDPFKNVRSSESIGVPGWKNAVINCNEKMTRINKFAQDGELANESVRDSLMDLANFSLIALILLEENESN